MQVLVEAKRIAESRIPPKVIFFKECFSIMSLITCGGGNCYQESISDDLILISWLLVIQPFD